MATVGAIKLDTKRLDEIVRKLDGNRNTSIRKVAFGVEAATKRNIITKRVVDTGAYLNSVNASPQSDTVWWVHDGVEYGIYQEFGHHNVAARPCFIPAAEEIGRTVGATFRQELFR